MRGHSQQDGQGVRADTQGVARARGGVHRRSRRAGTEASALWHEA